MDEEIFKKTKKIAERVKTEYRAKEVILYGSYSR
jgi:predicted nucleotidyltransferase